MKEEVSAGIILFNDNEDRKFLLLNYPSKHWDFVKGKITPSIRLILFSEPIPRPIARETVFSPTMFMELHCE